jgi:exodeoxyribonuclease VII small subunit
MAGFLLTSAGLMMSEPPKPDPGEDPHTFERSLAALEAVVAQLERGDVGLEEAVALFEQGRTHLDRCRARLALAQARIEKLTSSPGASAADPLAPPEGRPGGASQG